MKISTTFVFLLTFFSSQAWSYGSDSSSKACEKPKFSHFQPANNGALPARGHFSFMASQNTHPDSLSVTIKGQSVAVTVTSKKQFFLVEGKIPDNIINDFVRINIAAETLHKCRGTDGWLLKVE